MAMQPSSKAMTFGQAFKAARAAGDGTFEYGGKKYTTEMAPAKTAPRSPDMEAGMSRGTRAKPLADAEAGRTRGIPADIENARPAAPKTTVSRYKPEEQEDRAGTATDTFKKGGRVTGYKGYGKAKKV